MTKVKRFLLLFITAVFSFLIYLLISYLRINTFGFPLDDGWIHQTYARNLAVTGEWAYIPGKTSGGSTAPLWTFILSLVYLTKTGPFFGTFFISFVLFLASGLIFQQLSEKVMLNDKHDYWQVSIPIFGLFFLLEWHMNWAALSGMEILLYVLVILSFFLSLTSNRRYWLPGLLAGLAVWVRPDGLTLLGPLFFVFILKKYEGKEKKHRIWQSLFAFLPFIVGYFVFNKLTADSWLPNTFYAKQSEYAVLYQTSILRRFLTLIGQPWISSAVILLPGFIYQIYISAKNRNWLLISMILWAIGYVAIYTFRLPVIYQHARYLMPTMPIFHFLGLLGSLALLKRIQLSHEKERLLRFGVNLLMASMIVLFLLLGVNAYQSDAAIIYEEMVLTSHWIRENIRSDEVIAAHDIGALGYYGEHDILDLAGLISPDVIPFIRDEEQLLLYLEDSNVNFVMTLSDWYDMLTDTADEIYRSVGTAVIDAGGQPMAVYEYDWSGE